MAGNAAPALGEGLRVAVGASWRDLRAAGDRIPGRLGPLDRAVVGHVRRLIGLLRMVPCSARSPALCTAAPGPTLEGVTSDPTNPRSPHFRGSARTQPTKAD